MKLRSAAGQHQLVLAALKRFPTEGVGGEVLQGVREMTQDYETRAARRLEVVKQLRALAERLHDTISKENLKPILDEIAAEINENTLDRLAAFLQTASEPQNARHREARVGRQRMAARRRCGHGRIAGGDLGLQGPPVDTRVPNGESSPDRERIYSYIKQEAGGEMSMVADLLSHMKPPISSAQARRGQAGLL